MRRAWLALVTVTALAMVGVCSSTTKHAARNATTAVQLPPTSRWRTLQDLANDACRIYADGTFVNAQAATVGKIHAITGGPATTVGPSHPWKWVLPNLPDETFAAWCWRLEPGSRYVAYVVGYLRGVDYRFVPLPMETDSPPRPGPLPVT